MKLSFNILAWNTWKTLHDTLHILSEELKEIDHEVIIVDNGSTDGCNDVATIKNPKNLGISKGKNQGIEASKGEYIFLLDGDIVPVPNSIRMLLNYLETHPEVKALGFYPNKFATCKNKGEQNDRNHEEYHEWNCHTLFDVKEYRGHCVYYGMYHRSVFDDVMFDEGYDECCTVGEFIGGYGWEDLDTYKQMEIAGIKQYISHINHAGGKYYHAINSSIRNMGHSQYMTSSMKRSQYFKQKWTKEPVAIAG